MSEPNRLPAAERYLRDPAFAVLVDTLLMQIQQGNYTPTELREAVVLAATRWEGQRPVRFPAAEAEALGLPLCPNCRQARFRCRCGWNT